jgi:succinate dehydrogenase / fumarate reductase cytochrome b subunit
MTQPARERPLSPHLQIYRPQITSVMSILHRATGVGLSFGLLVLMLWLAAAAAGADAYAHFQRLAGSPIGLIVLAGLSVCAFYHFCTGIRHLVLDTGRGYAIPEIYRSGYTALVGALALTIIFWTAVLL